MSVPYISPKVHDQNNHKEGNGNVNKLASRAKEIAKCPGPVIARPRRPAVFRRWRRYGYLLRVGLSSRLQIQTARDADYRVIVQACPAAWAGSLCGFRVVLWRAPCDKSHTAPRTLYSRVCYVTYSIVGDTNPATALWTFHEHQSFSDLAPGLRRPEWLQGILSGISHLAVMRVTAACQVLHSHSRHQACQVPDGQGKGCGGLMPPPATAKFHRLGKLACLSPSRMADLSTTLRSPA